MFLCDVGGSCACFAGLRKKATATLIRVLAICNQGVRPEPKIVYIWGLNGPDGPPTPSKKMEGVALHLFGRLWRPLEPV